MNGQVRNIPDPVAVIDEEKVLLDRVLTENGFPGLKISGAAVYTRKDVLLMADVPGLVFTRQEYLEWVGGQGDFLIDRGVNVTELTETLVKLVKPEE